MVGDDRATTATGPQLAFPGAGGPSREPGPALPPAHLQRLGPPEHEAGGPRFDLIFVDPPTFSNSKRMEGVLDVQRDHVGMIRRSMKLLRPAGRLVFSTNYTRFKLDAQALADLSIEDISSQTIPKDFERNARIHRCFVIRFKANPAAGSTSSPPSATGA